MKFVIFLFALCACSQDFFEVRASQNQYRYVDWSRTFNNKIVTDLYYVGVKGYNELDACLGYALRSRSGLSVTPLLCGTTVTEDNTTGIKIATVIAWEKGKWKADGYYARLQPLKGITSSYDVLDTGNLTHTVTRNWEIGVSTGFFRQDGKWNAQYGPLVRRNDKSGYWGVSLRTGQAKELRVIRTFTLMH